MYKAFYYWIYHYLSKLNRTKTPGIDAILFIGILQLLNIISIGRLVYHFTNFKITKDVAIYVGLILAAFLFGLNYFYLFKGKEEIFQIFKL